MTTFPFSFYVGMNSIEELGSLVSVLNNTEVFSVFLP